MANIDERRIGRLAMNGRRTWIHREDTPWGDAIHVDCERQAIALAGEIMNPDRYFPIICLTACIGEREPALDPVGVRTIVGPAIPIYVITKFLLTMKLAKRLPRHLCVYLGSARVWWPEVSQQSQSSDHPRFFDPLKHHTQTDGYRRLAAEFSEHPDLAVEPHLVLSERVRTKEEQQRRTRLLDLRRDRGEGRTRPAPQAGSANRERTLRLVAPVDESIGNGRNP